MAIAFFIAMDDASAFDRALRKAGFQALSLTLGAPGPRVEYATV